MPMLTIITGNPKSGKSGLLTHRANHDPNGIYLGMNNDEKGGFLKQSRSLRLDKKVPFIFIKEILPTAEDIRTLHPKIKTIYIDEAQNGTSMQSAIFSYLDAGYDVVAGGVMHNWTGTRPLMERADKIIIVNGGVPNLDNKPADIANVRAALLDEYLKTYKNKISFVDFKQYYLEEKSQCR